MKKDYSIAGILSRVSLALVLCVAVSTGDSQAQFDRNWLSVGSLHNWYSAGGAEIEHGFVARQQFGLHWPGIYRLRDAQAAKGFWIGARNVQGPDNDSYAYRVVHIGPRVRGVGEMFPTQFETVSAFSDGGLRRRCGIGGSPAWRCDASRPGIPPIA
jgi:hypothetical protein